MQLSELDYDLPEELIALRPVEPRSSSRLLVSTATGIHDHQFFDLPDLLSPGDRLIFNDTSVIRAALRGTRHRGGADAPGVEINANLDQPVAGSVWRALVRPARKLKAGDYVDFGNSLNATILARKGEFVELDFNCPESDMVGRLECAGAIPLPPYIAAKRRPDRRDETDYQAIFAARPGAVAAPTASLHFDDGIMRGLAARGIESSFITLHVGAGTFLPIRSQSIDDHQMQSERAELTARTAAEINRTISEGNRIIAVGTTALRLLETAADEGRVRAWKGKTRLFIRPGHEFGVVSGLITNFHLPGTTLLVLVAALVGAERLRQIYLHAVSSRYRFFSFGDSSLLIP
ncbi:MAG: tRNA preQ1(34) S-adenosylmethionine ribosyltransferase-isomerase QueA [Rhodobacteraceae bacterium]|nr:tRNA preQ1(34) S-adenosylmethionine ribosyltransferase-isomerase QueA [Paracoccaceae bacterium]